MMISFNHSEFGYLGPGQAAEAVLDGSYQPPSSVNPYTTQFIKHLQQPIEISHLDIKHTLTLNSYQTFWQKA